MGLSPAAILVDVNGNVIHVVEDGGNKRMAVESAIKPGSTITVISGAPTTVESIVELLKNGTSGNMVVDGSTPVTFKYDNDPTRDIRVTSLRFVFSASSFVFDGSSFGKGGGALANGIEVKLTANGGDVVSTLVTLTLNEDFFRLLEFSISQSGSTDIMAASVVFGGQIALVAGSGDKVEVVINDDLTSGARGINYLTGTLYGYKE